jgi:hypothetical protein
MHEKSNVIRDPVQSEGFEGTKWFGLIQRGGCYNINEDETYAHVRDNASIDFDLGGFVGLRLTKNAS